MKKGLTILTGLLATGLLLTGCGAQSSHHAHHPSHSRTTEVRKGHHRRSSKRHSKKSAKVNKKDVDKSGLSNDDIKKDSRAVNHHKKSYQPVD